MESHGILDSLLILIQTWAPAFTALIFGAGYIFIILCARRIWIFQRNIAHLHAYADMVEVRLMESDAQQAMRPRIIELLGKARNQVPIGSGRGCLTFEGAGKQLAAWRLVHDADRLSTDLWPEDQVEAYAVVARQELKAVGSASAAALSETIGKTLNGTHHSNLRPLVKEARGIVFDARDNYYEGLSDWQNKALWLVTITTGIVVLLAAALGNVTFLLLGAAGGLLARLSKTMTSKNIGFDYGVSWSVLFLAPLVGALTGWAGVLISNLVVTMELLNPALLQASGAMAENTSMVLAVLFGFSARLFEGVMSGAEAALTRKPASGSAD